MEYVAYLNGDLRALAQLCVKCIQNRLKTCLLVSSVAERNELSDALWSSYYFIPHSMQGEKFSEHQFIVISTEYIKSDAVINYLDEICAFKEGELKKLIAWGYMPQNPTGYKIYKLMEGKWLIS